MKNKLGLMLVLSFVSISTMAYDDEPGASDDSEAQVEDEATASYNRHARF